jgi:hypothetical protein
MCTIWKVNVRDSSVLKMNHKDFIIQEVTAGKVAAAASTNAPTTTTITTTTTYHNNNNNAIECYHSY